MYSLLRAWGLIVVWGVTSVAVSSAWAQALSDWEHGAAGYEMALARAKKTEKPLIVYFHANDSERCKFVEGEYFADRDIHSFLGRICRVEVNPEASQEDENIATGYGLKSDFGLYLMLPGFQETTYPVSPFIDDKQRKSPKLFLADMAKLVGQMYGKQAVGYVEKEEFEDALKCLDMAIEYNPTDYYVYYAQGVCHSEKAVKTKDASAWKDAESSFAKALELNPDDPKSKEQLERARQAIKMGGSLPEPPGARNGEPKRKPASNRPVVITGPASGEKKVLGREPVQDDKLKVRRDSKGVLTITDR